MDQGFFGLGIVCQLFMCLCLCVCVGVGAQDRVVGHMITFSTQKKLELARQNLLNNHGSCRPQDILLARP